MQVALLEPKLPKNWFSHIDASLSRQPLVKGERLVRYEVNAVMALWTALPTEAGPTSDHPVVHFAAPRPRGVALALIGSSARSRHTWSAYPDAVTPAARGKCKFTWLVLGGDPAARSHRVEQFTAL